MDWASTGARHGLRSCVAIVAAVGAALTYTTGAADARHHGHHGTRVHLARHGHHAHYSDHVGGYSPPTASIVIDGNSGSVLEESNPDALRHPASLTKVMTLYLLFERLEAGKIRLDTPLKVSEHASEQAPTKLGLKPGQTIAVEDAIKAVVTKSANDAAVVIAENLGGSEEAFCAQMTQKAHALGMSRTTYVNASGLPDDEQITTARDQALLGRAIQDRFPRLYRFFSTTAFSFHGRTIRGHNHLLGSVAGVDGIKTGYTRASGFNLITSVHRDGRFMVGVVLGGRSAFERDAHMRALIDANIRLASARRTAPVLAEHSDAKYALASVQPLAKIVRKQAVPPPADPAPAATATAHATVGSSEPIRPVAVKTIAYHTVTVRSASMQPMPVLVPVVGDSGHAAPQPAQPVAQPVQHTAEPVPNRPEPQAAEAEVQGAPVEPAHTIVALREPVPPAPAPAKPEHAPAEAAKPAPVKQAALPAAPPPHAHGGWVIQIGAYDAEQEARQHLSEARSKVHGPLAAADPFTERVQKGDKALYRARFAGFDKATAEAACKQLKHNDFACLAIRD
ncbi:MAG TPA: D-alanyl-D-alanine carboxypeptidase [Xanthobacteraceae bacterium]|nr:D-alanyl-D-alanine carboxypeptidase [Xanthobacteraceae bacterium]